jgi:hypothetical protein
MRKYLIALLIGMILIAGCGEDEQVTTGKSPYIGGNKGLIAEFEPFGIEEDGVYTIYDDETFPVQVLLKNKGEENIAIGNVKVELYGIYLGDFTGISSAQLTNSEEIEGISEVNSEGGEQIINFGSDVQYLPDIQGDFVPLEILASYVYRYKTKTSIPKVCFKEDLRDPEVCDVDEKKTSYSSAAPIQVRSVEENPAGSGKVSLSFEIENVAGGSSTIPGQEFNTRYDQLQYRIIPSTEAAKWKCTAAGREDQARFADKTATIICTLKDPLEEGAKYTKEIVLEIEYDYRDVIQESLRVRSSE